MINGLKPLDRSLRWGMIGTVDHPETRKGLLDA